MNRLLRRIEARGTPAKLRGVPVVSITREDLAAHFPPSHKDGDVITMRGYGYETRKGKRVVTRCEPGKEKPFKLEVRRDAVPIASPDSKDDITIIDRPGRDPICRISAATLAQAPGAQRDGDYVTFTGVRWWHGKLGDCEPGKETRFKLEVRA